MTTSGRIGCWKLGLVSALAVGGVLAQGSDRLCAQNITLDGTLGPAGTLTGPEYIIPQADGQTVDTNLFHSFGKFGLDAGERAVFESATNIRNILSRVTGGSASFIDGEIFTQSSSVNLFLINPSGISFGPNASLDVGGVNRGSFVATTVDALVWPNGEQFSATNPGRANSLLTIVGDPSGFLSSLRPPQPIASSGSTLGVYEGQSLLLLGGDVTLDDSSLYVNYFEGGRIDLGGVSGAGTVGLNANGNDLRLSFPDDVARADVSITNGTVINVAAEDGGSIAINARNLDISGESWVRAGIGEDLGSVDTQAGDISLSAQGAINVANSLISNNVRTGSVGNGGDINITTGSLSLTNGAQVAAATRGQGNAGKVTIVARDTVSFDGTDSDGFPSGIFNNVESGAVGNSGGIEITTGLLSITDDALLNASIYGQGNAGSVNILANDNIFLDGSNIRNNVDSSEAVGNSGGINITTGSLSVTNVAQIQSQTSGQGDAGNVTIVARDTVSLDGRDTTDRFPSAIFTSVEPGARGNGGNIYITTGSLSITNRAQLLSNTEGTGNAGNIFVEARDQISLLNSTILSEVTIEGGVGNGGDINIKTGSLLLKDGSALLADLENQGNAGNITIEARDSIILEGEGPGAQSGGALDGFVPSQITATVESQAVGTGGNINILAGSLAVTDEGFISANTFGEGDAGDIIITTGNLSATNGARISASTFGAGDAGNLTIDTSSLIVKNTNISTSTQGEGNAGNLTVRASESIELSGEYRDQNGEPTGPGGLLAQADIDAKGQGGNLTVETKRLSISNSSKIQAATFGDGNAGEIKIRASEINVFNTPDANNTFPTEINAGSTRDVLGRNINSPLKGNGGTLTIETGRLSVRDGARISVQADGEGDVGELQIDATESVELSGQDSGLFAQATAGGDAGSLTINTLALTVQDEAEVTVSSPQGQAGNLTVRADSLLLDRGNLTAVTGQGQGEGGANIILQVQDLLQLRNESRIAADAFGTANGGNINIDTDFLIAQPPTGPSGSDIRANAIQGNGGRLDITASGIFGIEFRPNETPFNDITASSELGDAGVVTLDTPDVDPSRGLVTLPTDVIDASGLIVQSCTGGRGATTSEQSEFIITGRGGLPPNPTEPLSGEAVLTNWATLEPEVENRSSAEETAPSSPRVSAPTTIVEAQGWVIGANGQVVLTATAPSVTPNIPGMTPSNCYTP